jgi:hypothetical protein
MHATHGNTEEEIACTGAPPRSFCAAMAMMRSVPGHRNRIPEKKPDVPKPFDDLRAEEIDKAILDAL